MRKILIRKAMNVEEMKKAAFKEWCNSILHWKLSEKLYMVNYRRELEAERVRYSAK